MRNLYLYLLFFLFTSMSYAHEYWYPVGFIKQNQAELIFFIHQVSSNSIDLWSFNSVTKEIKKELPSHLNPAGFRLLPDESGFSFVDNGIIRVKHFNKRSTKSLEIYEPIYDISLINWKNGDTCYFHAKYQNNYGIFQLSQSGQVDCLIKGIGVDYLYPQEADETLFYIKRTKVGNNQYNRYQIAAIPYPKIMSRSKGAIIEKIMTDDKELFEHGNKEQEALIFDFGIQPIAYLKMTSKWEGYLLAHDTIFDDNQQTFKCKIYHLKFDQKKWLCEAYSLLEIPAQLLFNNDDRLYEGIVPFIVFSDYLK